MLVEIYGMNGCGYCEDAVALCKKYKLPYNYYQLDEDFDYMEFNKLFPFAVTFPQIVINGDAIGGFSDFKEIMEIASE